MRHLVIRNPVQLVLIAGVLSLSACIQAPDTAAPEPGPEITERTAPRPQQDLRLRVVFLGNSLAAGYGLDPSFSFPAIVQQKIDSLGWPVIVVNAGISGETTAGGLSRLDWLLRERIDVLVLELGGNDGLRGFEPKVTKDNLQQIIDRTRARYPEVTVILAGMQVPTNLGLAYTATFRDVYSDLARANGVELIPFLLEGVGGMPELNQADGIHPTAAGHRIVAETVWHTLEPVLRESL